MYFPRHKVGQSKKLTHYWRGPFRVVEKCSDVTYKVLCGMRERPQVIHVDRMRKKRGQVLLNEQVLLDEENANAEVDDSVSLHDDDLEPEQNENAGDSASADLGTDSFEQSKRRRKPPAWMSDYTSDF